VKVSNTIISFINTLIAKEYIWVFLSLVSLFSCQNPTETKKPGSVSSNDIPAEPVDTSNYLGIQLSGKDIIHGEIKRNELLANILQPYGVDGSVLSLLTAAHKDVFDIRKIRSGNRYSVIYSPSDSLNKASHFIYNHSPSQYLVLVFGDSNYMYMYQLPVDTIERVISAKISGSLIQTLLDKGVPGELGFRLSEILAWQIDFFKIRKDDVVKVIYDEYHVNGKYAELGRIKAVEFNWMDTPYYGFYYPQDADNQYFDDQGKSLRKAFLKSPLDYTRISSRYTLKRFHPVQKIWKAHLGTDYAAPTGTPIRSVGVGIVVESGYGRGNGNYVKVQHNETFTTQYLHMSKIHKAARKGKKVTQGQVIGFVGSTGLATGPHLCFRFWKNGKQIDPFKVKTPPTIPIQEAHRGAFEKSKELYIKRLNDI
jgi:murein DD-endopeptidase MepM/ murein hydrolase activator NlpD